MGSCSINSYHLWYRTGITHDKFKNLVTEDVLRTMPRDWFVLAEWENEKFQVVPTPWDGYPKPLRKELHILWRRAGMISLLSGGWVGLRGNLGVPTWGGADVKLRNAARVALERASMCASPSVT